MKRIRRVSPFLFLAVLLPAALQSSAQSVQPRIRGNITERTRTVLAGSRTPQASRGQDLGAVPPETPIDGITLVFKRSAAQQSALDQLLADQQNVDSPLYHHWLTPDQFSARFGVAEEDIAATSAWLRSHGFNIDETSPDRITFSGTAAQVEAAFGTGMHFYQVEGQKHFAPASDLTLPAALARLTAAVLHLSDFRPNPIPNVQTSPRPAFTSFATQAHYLTPKDMYAMYDFSPALQQKANGRQAIAVVGQSYVNTSRGFPVSDFGVLVDSYAVVMLPVLVPGSGVQAISPGDEGESEIDLEYASATLFGGTVYFVYVGANQNYDVFDALAFAIQQDVAPVVSVSYGRCELAMSATELDQGNALLQQAAAQGQTVVAASGDQGSTACVDYTSVQGITTAQQQSLAVGYPASSPYVTAVGGTQMAPGTFDSGASSYWAPASGSDAISSLLSYVPEVVWNESSALNDIVSSGGGASMHFPRPAWQSGVPGIPAGSFRLVPDVALQSSIQNPGFLVCSDDQTLVGSQTGCYGRFPAPGGKYATSGGTSFAAPMFAGFVANLNLIEQTQGLGNINPTLYAVASNPALYSAAFHDITSGTSACVTGIGPCASPGNSTYAATAGYDQATGLGSIDFAQLVASWPASKTANLIPTTTVVALPQYTAKPGDSIPLQISVSSSAPFSPPVPTGSFSVAVDGTVVQPSLPISTTSSIYSQAGANYTFIAPSTTGSHLITFRYPGDATHGPSSDTAALMVGTVTATGSFSLSAADVTLASGSTGSTQVTLTPSGGYTGRVVWSLSANVSTAGAPALCYRAYPPLVSGTTTTSLEIGTGAACTTALRGFFRAPVGPQSSVHGAPSLSAPKVPRYAGLVLCTCLVGVRRKMRRTILLVIPLLAVAVVGLNGCGGSASSAAAATGGTTSAPATHVTYAVRLIGTDSVNQLIVASTNFTVTVN